MGRWLAFTVIWSALGCQPGLGECDLSGAREVVFVAASDADVTGVGGLPAFAGQALLISSCGHGSFCHAPGIEGGGRRGAPIGLDFDLRLACDERSGTGDCTDEAVMALEHQRFLAFRDREIIWESVANGTMPPPPNSRAVTDVSDDPVRPNYVRGDGSALPTLETDEGRAILRNWLTCGAPFVATAELVPFGRNPGDWCGDVGPVERGDARGDCRYGEPVQITPPEPTWPAIYERVIGPLCGQSCHAAEADERFESDLDLSDPTTAYDQMVGRTALGAFCATEGQAHVVPGDSAASLLIQKLEGTQTCGDSMPLNGAVLPPDVVAPIRAWIMAGASR